MDDQRNLMARARIIPREGLVELMFERHHILSPALFGMSTFVMIADFKSFWTRTCTLII